MAGRYVFAPMAGAESDAALLKNAATLARQIEASVEAAFVEPDNSAYLAGISVVDGLPSAALSALSDAQEEGLKIARQAFKSVFGDADDSEARFCGALSRKEVSGLVRLAAFTVIDSASAAGAGPFSTLFEDFLFTDAAPVVVARGTFNLDNISIAWNGSREAATAMKFALPLLRRADKVCVLQAGEDTDGAETIADPVQAQMWLQARGVDARQMRAGDGYVGEALMKACTDHDCGLLVAGAYGHSRARQMVFGGATRAFVQNQEGPSLLLAH